MAQAIENAIGEQGFEILESPMSPLKLFNLYYGEKEG
jgi:hypothetical protein